MKISRSNRMPHRSGHSNHFHYAPQPNLAFKWDVHASHGRPLTLALGFVNFGLSLFTVTVCDLAEVKPYPAPFTR